MFIISKQAGAELGNSWIKLKGQQGGRVVDYNATSWAPTDQLKLG